MSSFSHSCLAFLIIISTFIFVVFGISSPLLRFLRLQVSSLKSHNSRGVGVGVGVGEGVCVSDSVCKRSHHIWADVLFLNGKQSILIHILFLDVLILPMDFSLLKVGFGRRKWEERERRGREGRRIQLTNLVVILLLPCFFSLLNYYCHNYLRERKRNREWVSSVLSIYKRLRQVASDPGKSSK